jgi:hypothetical protein
MEVFFEVQVDYLEGLNTDVVVLFVQVTHCVFGLLLVVHVKN